MAKKKEIWVDSDGCNHDTELNALVSDMLEQIDGDHFDFSESNTELTDELRSAIDALHEYAHRGDRHFDDWIHLMTGITTDFDPQELARVSQGIRRG